MNRRIFVGLLSQVASLLGLAKRQPQAAPILAVEPAARATITCYVSSGGQTRKVTMPAELTQEEASKIFPWLDELHARIKATGETA